MQHPQSDLLIDRKRLKKQLYGWRALAIIAVFGSLALVLGHNSKLGKGGARGDYIAQLTIEGMMEDDPKRDELFKQVLEDDRAKAVIVRWIHRAVRLWEAKKSSCSSRKCRRKNLWWV